MPRFRGQVANFSAGALSPGAQDRIEAATWNAGAETLENVLVRRGGGIRTRPGLRIAEVDDGDVTGRSIPAVREAFQSPARWYGYDGGRLGLGTRYAARSLSFGKAPTPPAGTMFALDAPRRVTEGPFGAGWRSSIGRQWVIDPSTLATQDGGGSTPGPHVGFDSDEQGLLDGQALTGSTFPSSNLAQYTADAWGQRRWALKRFELEPPVWPLRTLTLAGVVVGDPNARLPLTHYTARGELKPHATFSLWGQIAGIPSQWFSLTRMGPFDSLDDLRASNAIHTDRRATSQTLTFTLEPGRIVNGTWQALDRAWLTANGAEAFVPVEGDRALAVAYSRIALVETGLHVFARPGNAVGGTTRWTIRSVSSGFETQDGNVLQGTRTTPALVAAGERALATTVERSRLRMVEWTPESGVHLLCTFSPDGVEVTEVTRAGEPLRVRDRIVVDLRPIDNKMDEVVFAPTENALYVFHEALAAPKVLHYEAGTFRVADLAFTAVSRLNKVLPAGTTPDATRDLTDRSVPHADYTDDATAYWGGPGQGVRSGAFAYGRLALFGSGKHPNMIAFSAVGDYTRFVPDDINRAGDVSEPFHALTAGAENLHAGLLGRRLVAFGESAEYFLPSEEISGRRLAFRKTSQHGSPRGGRALNVGDAIVFRQASPDGTTGVDLRMMVFSDEESGFRTPSLAPFSEHLVRDVEAYAYQPGAQDGGARLWCVRSDGQLSVLSIDRAAQVNAWSECRLPAVTEAFEIASIADRVFVLVRMGNAPHLMELSYDDATGSVLDLATVVDSYDGSGLIALGREARDAFREMAPTVADSVTLAVVSSVDPPFNVTWRAGGDVAVPDTGMLTEGARVEVGLPVQWTVRTLPFVPRTSTGTAVAVQKTRVVRANVDYETAPDTDPPLLPILRIRDHETARPSRITWPRRVDVEDGEGLWIPTIPLPQADSERIVQCPLGPQRGWRNRTTVAIRGRMPCAIVGLSWMVAGSGG